MATFLRTTYLQTTQVNRQETPQSKADTAPHRDTRERRGRGNYYLHRKLLFTLEILHLIEILGRDEAEEIIIFIGNYYLHWRYCTSSRYLIDMT
jgi:hypothetical protein